VSSLKGGTDTRQGLGVWHCNAYALYGIGEQMRSYAGQLCDGILSHVVNARKTDSRRQFNCPTAPHKDFELVSVGKNRAKAHEL
jgi:hypothetical protein